ncbi:peptide chain release factor N(5)-glutamine methyltransferase [Nitrosomonas sp.]|uniref:peptide chain release factor N(5)-glutamine methyltransferase n=1 Tax=Nitrosomonas sp. TaxID=42353 RepID=UPI0025D09AEC|nr:peptide chain release factor N(5)-glutamine methyltransferase [Nitrosomonas sp.]
MNQCRHDRTTPDFLPCTVSQVLDWSVQKIEHVDARALLQHVMQVNHAYLLAHADDLLSSDHFRRFSKLVWERIKGVPIAYLTGLREFYDLTFKVTPAVLIPRPETELLVEQALAKIPESRAMKILDLGTGSGAIAITIAKHRPRSHVTAIDLSIDAIAIAKWNAQNLATGNIRIVQSNWFEKLVAGKSFDLIVSNPPYVAQNDPHLQQGDLRFEPDVALSTHDNGLACIRYIIATAPAYLVDGGQLLLEHGYDQSVQCRDLLEAQGFCNIHSQTDLAGIERVSGGSYYAENLQPGMQ